MIFFAPMTDRVVYDEKTHGHHLEECPAAPASSEPWPRGEIRRYDVAPVYCMRCWATVETRLSRQDPGARLS